MSELASRLSRALHDEASALFTAPELDRRIADKVRSRQRRRQRQRRAVLAVPVVVVVAAVTVGLLGLARTTNTTPSPRSALGPALHAPAKFAAGASGPTAGATATNGRRVGEGAPAAPSAVLSPGGIGPAHFNEAAAAAARNLETILGPPAATRSKGAVHLHPMSACDVTAFVAWPQVTAYFDHGRFVGYASTDRALETAAGLRIGETVGAAERIYNGRLSVSLAQGGSYLVTLPSGRLDGLTDGATASSVPSTARIASIDAGAVGCPGLAP